MIVRFALSAQRDLDGSFLYIRSQNAEAASRIVSRLVERARALAEQPFSGKATDEPDTRMLFVPDIQYLIFYDVVGDIVEINHIRHMSRDQRK